MGMLYYKTEPCGLESWHILQFFPSQTLTLDIGARQREASYDGCHGEGSRAGAADAVAGPRRPAHGALAPPRGPRLRGHLRQHGGGPRARARRAAGRRRRDCAARHPPGVHPGRAGRRRRPQGPQQARRRLLAPHAGLPGEAHRGAGRGGRRRQAQGEVARWRRQYGVVIPGGQEARHSGRLLLAVLRRVPRHHAQDPHVDTGRRPQRQGMARAAGDAAAGRGDAAAPHVAHLVEQRGRGRGPARHLPARVPEQQAQRGALRDGPVQLVPRGRGRRVRPLPPHPAHRPALCPHRRYPAVRGAVPAGEHEVPGMAGRAPGRVRRVRGLRQPGHARPAAVQGAGRGAGADRPAVLMGRASGLHRRPDQRGVAGRVPSARARGRDRHGGQLVLPAACPGAPRRGVLRVALRVELDDGGRHARRAHALLALLLRPLPGPELRRGRVEDRPGRDPRRGRRRDQGGSEEQGGGGHLRCRDQGEGDVAQGGGPEVRRRGRLVAREFQEVRRPSKRMKRSSSVPGRPMNTVYASGLSLVCSVLWAAELCVLGLGVGNKTCVVLVRTISPRVYRRRQYDSGPTHQPRRKQTWKNTKADGGPSRPAR